MRRDGVRVFGNGTGFVWYGDAQEEQVMECALIDEVEARFVAVHEAKGWLGGESPKCLGHTVQPVAGGLGGDLVLEHAGLESPSTAQAPEGGDHLLDHAEFDAIGGIEASKVLVQQGLESFGRFILHQGAAGEEAVAQGVLGRPLFALPSSRTPRAGAVGPGRQSAPE